MTILGDKTPQVAIYKSESHKLHHSLPVKSGKVVKPGYQVVINPDGTIQNFESGNSLDNIIGVAVNSSETPAYKANKQYGAVEATVSLSGHAIINAASGAALNAGPVKPSGAVLNGYPKYVQATSGTDRVTAIALGAADSADDVIQVVIL